MLDTKLRESADGRSRSIAMLTKSSLGRDVRVGWVGLD